MSDFSDIFADATVPLLAMYGEDVAYTRRAGGSFTLTCVADSGENVQNKDRVYKTIWAPLANFTAEPVKGDSIVAGPHTYRVADIEKDSENGRLLLLSVSA